MSAEIIRLNCLTTLDIPANAVLEHAINKLDHVILAGWDTNGELYCASSLADGGEVLWLLEKMKQRVLDNRG